VFAEESVLIYLAVLQQYCYATRLRNY